MNQIYLYGAGGHAKVILDILKSNNIVVSEMYDDNPSIKTFEGIPVLQKNVCSPLIISIGDNAMRKKTAAKLQQINYSPAVCAKSAIVSDSASMDWGTIVVQGAIVQHSARTGKHCIINTGASVDHDCIIGDFVHLAPHSTLCGNVQIGEGTLVGAGAIVLPGIKIGKWTVIGAGSVVTKDIPDSVVAIGSPCKIMKYI